MKIDTTRILKNLKGDDMRILTTETENGKSVQKEEPMVLREVITNLLNMEDQQNRLTAEKKGKGWQIMKKMWDGNGKKVELTVDDRAFINERAKIFYPTMTCGVVGEALEEKVDKGKE